MSDEENSDGEKGKLSTGLGKIADRAKDSAKSGVKKFEDKTKEVATQGMRKIGEKAQEAIKDAIEPEIQTRTTSGKMAGSKIGRHADQTGRNIEHQVQTWVGWFWSTIAYVFVIMISFVISSTDGRFALLPIILIIGFPFFLYYAIVSSIPEIKIGNRVIFSRRDLSVRNQLTFTAHVARTFSKEMIENSPVGAFLIYSFLILLAVVLIAPFLN